MPKIPFSSKGAKRKASKKATRSLHSQLQVPLDITVQMDSCKEP
jgi:hypothetical protein